jgi:hypothetical protein
MDVIVGLGQAGCRVADEFAKHSQYKIFKIDAGVESTGANVYSMPVQTSSELYESSCPSLIKFFKKIKSEEEILFIVGGGGKISGATLQLMEQLKSSGNDLSLLYVKPDITLIGGVKYIQDRVTYYILQEYARSGMFERIYLIYNPSVEEVAGEVPVEGYYEKLNETVVSTIHMINIFKNTDSILENISPPDIHTRISTFGIIDVETGEEKSFFPLDNVREKCYYFAIQEKSLKDGKMFKSLKEQIRSKAEKEDVRISYRIHKTKYDKNFAYCVSYSDAIQGEEKLKKSLTS